MIQNENRKTQLNLIIRPATEPTNATTHDKSAGRDKP
jgi:hypothetical protein